MNVRLFYLVLSAGLTLLGCGEYREGQLTKPSAPLTLSIEPVTAVIPNGIAEFKVEAIALAEASEMVLQVDLPETLSLYSGDLTWRGPVSSGLRHEILFSLRVPQSGQHLIKAQAHLLVDGKDLFTAKDSYTLGKAEASNGKAAAEGRVRDGVVEYELQ